MKKNMIIIGAGIAGLATGCYARMNGYDADIYEMHNIPGGMCTSWSRKGYTFDYCIHNLAGTASSGGLRAVWDELGVLNGVDIQNQPEFVTVEDAAGPTMHWYTDLDRLETHLKEIAPEDLAAIEDLVRGARKLPASELYAMQLGGMWRMLKVMPHLRAINRYRSEKLASYAATHLTNPFLKRAFSHLEYDMPGEAVPLMALVLFMSGMGKGDLGWPIGGSLAFSKRLEKRFLELGGKVHYRQSVDKIIVDNHRAVGIRLVDGAEYRADLIISAADGYRTIYHMLEGNYLTPDIEQYYGSAGDTSPFGFIIFLGVNGVYPQTPHASILLLDNDIDLGNVKQDSVYVVYYGPETGLAPEGKSVIKIEVQASYSYWKTRRDADIDAYRREKQRIADLLIDIIAPKFPGLRDRIEVIDTSTPPTAERFTGNRFGWQAGPPEHNAQAIQRKGLSVTLPGLEGFYHVGQWSMATLGVSSVAIMARNLVKRLCKEDGRKFTVK